MEMKNILYAHEILGKITMEDLFSFTSDEIKVTFRIVAPKDKQDSYYKAYLIFKSLILSYEAIKAKYGEGFEAPQYKEANNWMVELVRRINEYLRQKDDGNSFDILKEQSTYYKHFYNAFSGGVLSRPIKELDDFNMLVDSMEFTKIEKYELKKIVGIGNIKLLSKKSTNLGLDMFTKYKNIYDNKMSKYKDLYLKLKDIDFSLEEAKNKVVDLANKYDETLDNIRQALSLVFLEKVFADIEKDSSSKLDKYICLLENILDFSKETKDNNAVKEAKEEIKTELVSEDSLVIEAKDILASEQDLINNTNSEKLDLYLAQSFVSDENDNDLIKYKIVSLLLAMHSELEKYKNMSDIPTVRKTILGNLKDYIEVYKLLKMENKD